MAIDFSMANPDVAMQWTDALEQIHTGSPSGSIPSMVPFLATDTTGGAFPRGSVRWLRLGQDSGTLFDLLVTVSPEPTFYSSDIAVEYWNPRSTPRHLSTGLYGPATVATIGRADPGRLARVLERSPHRTL